MLRLRMRSSRFTVSPSFVFFDLSPSSPLLSSLSWGGAGACGRFVSQVLQTLNSGFGSFFRTSDEIKQKFEFK